MKKQVVGIIILIILILCIVGIKFFFFFFDNENTDGINYEVGVPKLTFTYRYYSAQSKLYSYADNKENRGIICQGDRSFRIEVISQGTALRLVRYIKGMLRN